MNVPKTSSISIAIAAAGLFTVAPIVAQESGMGEEAQVHCYGVNACKGQNDCKSANNACKGQGACMGKGFLNMTEPECAEKGGTVGE
ncbi:MAG: hypothetical protein V3V31_00880 [Methylococcales bacterium]